MILSLDHVNVRVKDIQRTLAFYRDVLGMRCGPVPGDSEIVDRAWIFCGDGRPVLHVGEGALALTGGRAQPARGSGSVDHVALECGDYEGVCARFARLGVHASYNDLPKARLKQIFVIDPDGVCLELNFRERAASA